MWGLGHEGKKMMCYYNQIHKTVTLFNSLGGLKTFLQCPNAYHPHGQTIILFFYSRKWSTSDPTCEEVTWEMGVYEMTISKLFAREQGPILMGGGGRIVLSLMSGDVVLASCLNNHASLFIFYFILFYFYFIFYYYYFLEKWYYL